MLRLVRLMALLVPLAVTSCASSAAGGDEEGRSATKEALLYIPNRVVDILDVVRVGASVGPGFGIDAQVTDPMSAVAVSRTFVGAGYQTLRRPPIAAGAEAGVGVGPATLHSDIGGWHRSETDARVGVHLALIGAHVALELREVVDAVLGLVLIDVANDDF